MPIVFGNFIEADASHEYLIIGFSSTTLPIQDRWRNNGLSADFLADYWGTFFPSNDKNSQYKRTEIKSAISYIANELLENTMKFSYTAPQYPISIRLSLFPSELRFYVSNSVHPAELKEFQNYVQKLLTADTKELYITQIEANAHEKSGTSSRLGFLTMINDYHATVAWKFDTASDQSEVMMVTVMAQLKLSDMFS